MDDLAAFTAARLDEDEAAAKAAMGAPPVPQPSDGRIVFRDYGGDKVPDAMAAHIARHDPARVLREVEAKRAILNRWEFARNQVAVGAVNERAGYGPADAGWLPRADSHELDVRSIAATWSDHPDYRAGWAPGHG